MIDLSGLTHKDWLLDGYEIRGELLLEMWGQLDWSRAYVDPGPSPSGNLGPYWHVPRTEDGDEFVHRLYPKLLRTKWAPLVRQAMLESAAKAVADG